MLQTVTDLALRDTDATAPSAEEEYLADIEPYHVAELDGRFIITLADRSIIDPSAVRSFITNHTTKGIAMTEAFDTTRPEDQYDATEVDDLATADALLARFDPQRSPAIQKIGAGCKSLREYSQVGRLWSQLDRTNGLGQVTLDTDPETPGRPQSLRPDTAQLHLIALPEWHHLYAGDDSVAVVYYHPTTTWMGKDERIGPNGVIEVIPKALASQNDNSGYLFVMDVRKMSFTQVDEWFADVRAAVRLLAGVAVDEDPADIEARRNDTVRDRFHDLSRM